VRCDFAHHKCPTTFSLIFNCRERVSRRLGFVERERERATHQVADREQPVERQVEVCIDVDASGGKTGRAERHTRKRPRRGWYSCNRAIIAAVDMVMNCGSVVIILTLFFLMIATREANTRVTLAKLPTTSSAKRRRSSKPSLSLLFRSFFVTLIDPTYQGAIECKAVSQKKSKKKGKGSGSSSVFGPGGAASSSMSFGPVCGPNGCH